MLLAFIARTHSNQRSADRWIAAKEWQSRLQALLKPEDAVRTAARRPAAQNCPTESPASSGSTAGLRFAHTYNNKDDYGSCIQWAPANCGCALDQSRRCPSPTKPEFREPAENKQLFEHVPERGLCKGGATQDLRLNAIWPPRAGCWRQSSRPGSERSNVGTVGAPLAYSARWMRRSLHPPITNTLLATACCHGRLRRTGRRPSRCPKGPTLLAHLPSQSQCHKGKLGDCLPIRAELRKGNVCGGRGGKPRRSRD